MEELIYLEVIKLLTKRIWHRNSSTRGILVEGMYNAAKYGMSRSVLLCESSVYFVHILIL